MALRQTFRVILFDRNENEIIATAKEIEDTVRASLGGYVAVEVKTTGRDKYVPDSRSDSKSKQASIKEA